MELVSTQFIKLSALENNKGQIEGIPANPRQFKEADLAKMEKSLQEHPDMIALRELLVYQQGKKYIVVAGNMRLFAMRKLGYTEAPCKVIPADTPIEEIKAVLILDNAQFGEWDYDALANEWHDMPLTDWGVPVWEEKEQGEEEEGSEEKKDKIDGYLLLVGCPTEEDRAKLGTELAMRGYQCAVWFPPTLQQDTQTKPSPTINLLNFAVWVYNPFRGLLPVAFANASYISL